MTKETSAQEVSVHVEEAPAKRLLDAKAAANMCGVSRSHFLSMHNSGRIPLPVRLGRAVRWDRRELDSWISAGCPSRNEWAARQGSRSTKGGRA